MESRAAANALNQIGTLLELLGEAGPVSPRALQSAARTVASFGARELPEVMTNAALGAGQIDPVVREILMELVATESSALLEQLQEQTPEGLVEMLRVPGLGPTRIRQIRESLGIETLQELEQSARSGALAALPRFGERTAEKILRGIADLREAGAHVLWQHGRAEAGRLCEQLAAHPAVLQVAIAGSIRRCCEIVRDVDLVAAVRGVPSVVAAGLASMRGVRAVLGGGGQLVSMRMENGVQLDLACVGPEHFAIALWRATGSESHVRQMIERASSMGFTLVGDEVRSRSDKVVPIASESDWYSLLGLQFVPPELREGIDELSWARTTPAEPLLVGDDIVGALHCHSQYSDGGATVGEMADAALQRGWKYLGVSDHSQSNTYAGGLSRDAIERQHDEIDAINASFDERGIEFRVLKGIEADILPCGRVDYDAAFLERFDFVIGSIHTRYGMNERQMTDRVLKALDDPHLTVFGHPTGRLLLAREPYAIDLNAVIEKAGEVGVAVELNADPHRLDIDWRACRVARAAGTRVSIGPDAHSPAGLDHIALGIAIARKGALGRSNVLNSMSLDEVLRFARARRVGPANASMAASA